MSLLYADILNNLKWDVMPRERWGIVGKNGAGKSTLLKSIISGSSGNVNILSGKITVAKNSRVGYLEQKGVLFASKVYKHHLHGAHQIKPCLFILLPPNIEHLGKWKHLDFKRRSFHSYG